MTGQVSASDQINGGAGTDTLKMYGTYDSTKMPLSISGIEVLQIATAADAHLDLSTYTKAANGVEKVIIDDASLISGKKVTTGDDQTLSLATE